MQASGSRPQKLQSSLQTSLGQRRKKMWQHFEDLEQCYLSIRTGGGLGGPEVGGDSMEDFTNCLAKFTRFTSFRPLASLSYAVDLFNGSSSIVSRCVCVCSLPPSATLLTFLTAALALRVFVACLLQLCC